MSSDPFKAAVPMLRSAVEAEKRASGGDAKAAEEAAQLYITALALLDEAAGMEGKYPPKVLGIIGQKAADVRHRGRDACTHERGTNRRSLPPSSPISSLR